MPAAVINFLEPSVKGFEDAEYLVVGFMSDGGDGYVHGRDFGSGQADYEEDYDAVDDSKIKIFDIID